MYMHNRFLRVMAIFICLALIPLTTCGKDSPTRPQAPEPTPPPPPPPPTPVATRIEISPSSATFDAVGRTVLLNAKVLDQNNAPLVNPVVTWTSSNPAVATVNTRGLVKAEKNGTAQVSARSGNLTAMVTVTVSQRASRVDLEPSRPGKMSIGQTLQITATVLDPNLQPISGAPVTWSSSEETVATVSPQGLVTAVGIGTAEIRARSGSAGVITRVTVEEDANRDLDALVALYRATNGESWTNNTDWLSSRPLDWWHGVSINESGRVTELHLSDNQLSGSIPPELAKLDSLRVLVLGKNRELTGPLPPGLIQTELGQLNMSSTDLCIPNTSAFMQWRSGILLKEGAFYCGSNALTALYNATNGTAWADDENWLTDVPLYEWYGVSVDTDGRVRALDLTENNLSGSLPAALGNLDRLESLDFSFNEGLAGPLPLMLTVLVDLERLILEGTRLCGPLIPVLQEWLDGIPNRSVTLCDETRPDYYVLAALYQNTNGPNWKHNDNWLSDSPLGTWHGVTTDSEERVTELFLGGNNLLYSIPSEIGQFQNLRTLFLSDNGLTGSIPPEIGLLQNLRSLYLSSNPLTGPIPTAIGQLQNLTELELVDNELTGSIPPEIGQLQNLTRLSLAFNRLTGFIPSEIGQLQNLNYLSLLGNRITGPIPSTIGQLQNLTFLNLSLNELSGSIPPEIGQLQNLTGLFLIRNRLSAGVPSEIAQLQNLTELNLGGNPLKGPIPRELAQLQNLTSLFLFENQLTGSIPPEIAQLQNLTRLYLGANQLTGSISPEIAQLQNLTQLDLGENQLTGSIPPEIARLEHLTELYLNHNELTGNIPGTFSDLVNLSTLALTGNPDMSGTLPSTLTSLNMERLLLGDTQLCSPRDPTFQVWLRQIPDSRVSICASLGRSAAYLTQATQSLEHPVPLVAGEDALLRVFVTTQADEGVSMPLVRATFYLDGAEVHSVDIPGSQTSVPSQIEEGDLSASANGTVPGSIVMPGLEMVVEIDPDGMLNPVLGVGGRLPTTGRLPVDIQNMPPLNLTLVPFLWTENPDRSILTQVEGLTAESDLFRYTRDVLPVRGFQLDVREPVWTSIDPTGGDNMHRIFSETTMIRTLDGASGHYMGVLRSFGGRADLPGFVSVSHLDGWIMAHELGHNFSLEHAPCGVSGDSNYPYSDGSVGAWGYDDLNDVLVAPETYDLMSYCDPAWISDYHFTKALRYRVSQVQAQGMPMAAAYAPSARSLLLWGGVDDEGEIVLEPAFAVDAQPSLPRLDGPYRLIGEDADGNTLFRLPFGMAEIDHSEGGSFAFVVPVRPDWPGQLVRVTLSGPEGIATLGDGDDRSAVLLLDEATGMVRGILRDWPEPDATLQGARRVLPEPGLEVVISRGLPELGDW